MVEFYVRLVVGRDIMAINNFFRIYDRLIDGIEPGIVVEDYNYGDHWTSIRTKDSLGLAKRFNDNTGPRVLNIDNYKGTELKELASLSKSWNLEEASIGLAAINAYYNSMEHANHLGLSEDTGDAFNMYKEDIKDKKVAVIGHFPFIERELDGICDLKILERNPSEGDYPDSACEYILPESDYVFITSCTIVNKTFPRLLELARNARVVMVGPSTPMAELLLDEGIFDLSGFIATDIDACINATINPSCSRLFDFGDRVSLNKL